MKLQPARGTQDLLPETCKAFRFINQQALSIAERYGYEEISTPIFEFSEVFHRTLGESSDMVSKETYTFSDRGGDSLTLRPEGTAGIARAFISNGMAQNLPLKLFYTGPMFRYERPQKGRYRQFHQLGVECLGLDSPLADIECLALAWDFLGKLDLQSRVQLQINSLGDHESRNNHRQKLVEYLQDFKSQLSADSQIRLEKNPLRILDSKDEGDKKIITAAPLLENHLNESSKDFFAKVLEGLTNLQIPYHINKQLVRGIDYYTHTVFEFTTTELGAQSAVLAGGRYDGLIDLMGGPKTPGVGWASGIERIAMMVKPEQYTTTNKTISVISADDLSDTICLKLAHQFRQKGYHVDFPISGNIGKKLKRANKIGAQHALIVGESERLSQTVTVKNLTLGEQKTVSMQELATMQFN